MKAYIAISYSKRRSMDSVINTIQDTLRQYAILPFVFVDQYSFSPSDEKEMMQKAMEEISSCDLLLAETSAKGIGIGVEAGYARALGKTVIYLRHAEAEHSTTVSGISDYQVEYRDNTDLKEQLNAILPAIKSR